MLVDSSWTLGLWMDITVDPHPQHTLLYCILYPVPLSSLESSELLYSDPSPHFTLNSQHASSYQAQHTFSPLCLFIIYYYIIYKYIYIFKLEKKSSCQDKKDFRTEFKGNYVEETQVLLTESFHDVSSNVI